VTHGTGVPGNAANPVFRVAQRSGDPGDSGNAEFRVTKRTRSSG